MFLRLLIESFLRQKRRKALAGIAILLGTTAVTAMLALATTIGDRIHRELAVYGANIVVTPKAADLAVNIAGVAIHPASEQAYLPEAGLEKLKGIFWANNITAISPEDRIPVVLPSGVQATAVGLWFDHSFRPGMPKTGALQLHPTWKITGTWPKNGSETVVSSKLADQLGFKLSDAVPLRLEHDAGVVPFVTQLRLTGIVDTGDAAYPDILLPLETAQQISHVKGALTRIDISAKTRPEDAFARQNPDTLSPKQRDLWYCRPYANSIAYQIREAIPNSDAQQVRRVEQSEGTVLSRISGLMWLVSAAALLAAGFAVSAAMATAVLERRGEIGLMRSLGAGKGRIASLFYAESSILATAAGLLGYLAGSGLAWGLGRHIFPADGASPLFNPVLLPVIIALAVGVAIAGSTPAIRSGLRSDVSNVLRGND